MSVYLLAELPIGKVLLQLLLIGQSAAAEGRGESTAALSWNDGWGLQAGSEGGLAGGSNLNGWDDMDPMALLSGSVQSQAKAQDINSATPAPPITPLNFASQATQQRLPDEQIAAPCDCHNHHTKPASDAHSVQNLRAPSVKVDKPDSSKSQSECDTSTSGDQHKEADIKKHLDGREQGTSPYEAAFNEKHGAVPKDAHHSSRVPSSGLDSNQQDATATSICKGDAQQEAANAAADGAYPSKLESSVPQEAAVLTAESSLADVQSMLGQGDRAVIHTRAPGRDAFGPTLVYGYPGFVFEATQAGRIATVTIF